MHMLGKKQLLFFIILVEGYVVLASELLAIRLMVPFVGSGTETLSIIISAVLLPLAIGYHYGGKAHQRSYQKRARQKLAHHSVRRLLVRNLHLALLVLAFGLSYPFLELFFALLEEAGIHSKLMQTTFYSLVFLVFPVFLLGQTVPLVSHYFSRESLSEITGKMLFFSTTGSFLGSVFSTIVLMSTIGVHNTAIVTLSMLGLLAILIASHNDRKRAMFLSMSLIAVAYFFNSPTLMSSFKVVSNNAYNIISIRPHPNDDKATLFMANRSASSMLGTGKHKTFPYVEYIQSTLIDTLPKDAEPADILIIGAGGFTMGLDDKHHRYTFVDIDPALKKVAEKHFLPSPLSANKQFVAASARAFVRGNKSRYDLIILDVYNTPISIPMETTTREFLMDVKALMKPGGIVAANIISSPDYRDRFSVRYDNTFASVFANHTRQIIGEFNPWRSTSRPQLNAIYIYYDRPEVGDATVYTDDKNTYSLDRH
jgi:predicted membrane-bound spermidine synthase